jgi:hypothetical protein
MNTLNVGQWINCLVSGHNGIKDSILNKCIRYRDDHGKPLKYYHVTIIEIALCKNNIL